MATFWYLGKISYGIGHFYKYQSAATMVQHDEITFDARQKLCSHFIGDITLAALLLLISPSQSPPGYEEGHGNPSSRRHGYELRPYNGNRRREAGTTSE